MALKVRSHEILMGEMAVLAKGYRHERARLYQANRNLLQQLADIEAQVRGQACGKRIEQAERAVMSSAVLCWAAVCA